MRSSSGVAIIIEAPMTLRSHLYLLVAGTLLPMALFAAVAAALLLVEHERDGHRARRDRARARGDERGRRPPARPRSTRWRPWRASKQPRDRRHPRRSTPSRSACCAPSPAWVNIGLATPERMQLTNAVYAFGKPEPLAPVDERVLRWRRCAAASRSSAASRPAPWCAARRSACACRSLLGGEVRYVLSAPLNLKHLGELLQAQHLPEDWVIGLVDREQHDHRAHPGRSPAGVPASDSHARGDRRARPKAGSAAARWKGRPSYTAYVTSPLSGWVLGIGDSGRRGRGRRAAHASPAGRRHRRGRRRRRC